MKISPTIHAILDYARLAPSVHNTQPWQFHIPNGTTIELLAAPSRFLDAGDPTSREFWISLGACLETLLMAARGLGHTPTLDMIQTESIEQPIARITIGAEPSMRDDELLDSITRRHSHRGHFDTADIPMSLLKQCQAATAHLDGVSIEILSQPNNIRTVGQLTGHSMQLALGSPEFRQELATLVHENWSSSRVGMHGYVLNKGAVGSIWEKWSLKNGKGIAKKAQADEQKVAEASALFFIATKGDVPPYWLTAGRAYMQVCCVVTRTGYAHSTIAGPVEAASFHEDIEAMLRTPHRIQAMIRVGKAAPLTRTSPRLRVEELLT